MTTKPKPLLVGELNPYGSNPAFALYPLPEWASGARLCKILGLARWEYLDRFERVNLLRAEDIAPRNGAPKFWSLPLAREAAKKLLDQPTRTLILLGAQVATAFGLKREQALLHRDFGANRHTVIMLPHPSGRNRVWNDPTYIERVRELLKTEGVL